MKQAGLQANKQVYMSLIKAYASCKQSEKANKVFKSIAETIPSDVKLGLDLVSFMKEELGLCPSRKCLDFLLQACVNAKDKHSALVDGSISCRRFKRCKGD
ncbi:unnamed protein product [Cochlearia groenlandica]